MTEQQGKLPSIRDISRGQIKLTAGTALAAVVVDIAMHSPGVTLASLVAIGGVGYLSPEILEMTVPGSNSTQVVNTADRVIEHVLPEPALYADQRTLSKLKRLFHVGVTEELLWKQAVQEAERVEVHIERSGERVEGDVTVLPKAMCDSPVQKVARNMVHLASDLHININEIAGKAIFVCGIRRHGKTTLGARLAEQLGAFNIPMFIPDLEGDYISLADVLPRSIVAGFSGMAKQYADQDFAPLDTAEQAFQLGYNILEYGYQVILDMNTYVDLDAAVKIQVNIIQGMFKWANDFPEKRVPACVYLDEAQRFLPQNLNDSVILNKELVQGLLKAYMDIIAIGGKRGISPVILTQRFAQVNNKIMAQSEVFFLMRQTHDGDLKRCMEYASDPITKEQIAKFAPGQGVYIATDGRQQVTHFHQRESDGSRSKSPQAEGAQRYATMAFSPTGQPTRKSAQPVQQLPPLPDELFDEEEESGMSMHNLCEAVMTMADMRYKASEIIQLLEITEQEYREVVDYIRSHRSEFRASSPTSQANSVSASNSTSMREKKLHLVNTSEGRFEEGRSNNEVKNADEVGVLAKSELSEREMGMATRFFAEGLGINAIMKEFFPGVTGGEKYQRANVEIADALRKYTQVQKGA